MSTPINILIISHDSGLYGAQLSLLALLKNIDRRRYSPHVVIHNDGPLVDEIKKLNIPIHKREIVHWVASGSNSNTAWLTRLRLFFKNLRTRVRGISDIISKHNIHFIYTNTVTCIEGAIAARACNRPHIWHLREQTTGNSQLKPLFPKLIIKLIIHKLSSRIIVNSHHLYKFYKLENFQDKISVIHNGIDIALFSNDREQQHSSLKAALSLPNECNIVTTIAAIIPRKGINLLIDAASILTSKNYNIYYLIVGSGPYEYTQSLMRHAKALNINNRILFLGHRNDIPQILGGSDVLTITAEDEAFGRTAIEAMAAHVPVVATRCGGPEEIIVDGVTGFLAQSRTPSCVAIAIEKVLTNPGMAESFAMAGYSRAKDKFSVQAYTQKIEKIFNNLNSHNKDL